MTIITEHTNFATSVGNFPPLHVCTPFSPSISECLLTHPEWAPRPGCRTGYPMPLPGSQSLPEGTGRVGEGPLGSSFIRATRSVTEITTQNRVSRARTHCLSSSLDKTPVIFSLLAVGASIRCTSQWFCCSNHADNDPAFIRHPGTAKRVQSIKTTCVELNDGFFINRHSTGLLLLSGPSFSGIVIKYTAFFKKRGICSLSHLWSTVSWQNIIVFHLSQNTQFNILEKTLFLI